MMVEVYQKELYWNVQGILDILCGILVCMCIYTSMGGRFYDLINNKPRLTVCETWVHEDINHIWQFRKKTVYDTELLNV